MPVSDAEKYLVRKPLLEIGVKGVGLIQGRQLPTMTYMSNALVPNSNTYIEYGWIWQVPEPNPHIRQHAHEFDEIVVHLGNDSEHYEDLGAELEFFVEGQSLTFDTDMALYLPATVKHTPIVWKRVARPHIEMSITLGNGNYGYQRPAPGQSPAAGVGWQKPEGYDFERNLVRRPLRNGGPASGTKGCHWPPLTYMSNALVPGSDTCIAWSWIWQEPDPNPWRQEHAHEFNQIVLYIGCDPNHPEDLGAEIEFFVDGHGLVFDTSAALFLPAGLKHAPVVWKKVTRPHIQMTINLAGGDCA